MVETGGMTNDSGVRHPIFARFYMRLSRSMEPLVAKHRQELLAGLAGRVIEVGAGNGMNFAYYPATVDEVLAVEPEPLLRRHAEAAAARAAVPVQVVPGVAGSLPAETGAFDAAVVSLVLCSVPDPAAALGEIRRVLRPGGELRFYEHVRGTEPRTIRLQRAVDVVWPYLGGGCHTSRATVEAIEAAGFALDTVHRFEFRPSPLAAPVAPHVIGIAHRT